MEGRPSTSSASAGSTSWGSSGCAGSSNNPPLLTHPSPSSPHLSHKEKDHPSSTDRLFLSRLLFSRQSFNKKGSSGDSPKTPKKTREEKAEEAAREKEEKERAKAERRESRTASAQDSPRNRFVDFATRSSRSIRKHQWRLFRHRTFFGSAGSSTNRPLKPPRLTVRLPSADEAEIVEAEQRAEQRAKQQVKAQRGARSRRNTTTESIPGSARVGFLGDSGDSSGFVDEPSPMALPATPLSASSSISEGWKYSSQKILWKLKPKYMHFSHASSTSASSSTDSAWRSQDSATWRSVDGSEVVLRGSRLETLSAAERAALRSVATATLARMLPGISLHRQKDAFQTLRMKRQKLMKATRLGIGGSEVTRRPSSCSTDDERRSVFGAPLSAALEWERGQDAESRCQSLDDSAVSLCVPPNSMNKKYSRQSTKPVHSEPEIVSAMEEEGRWLYPQTPNLHQRSLPLVGSSSPPFLAQSLPFSTTPLNSTSFSSPPVSCSTQLLSSSLDAQQSKPRSRGFSASLERASLGRDPREVQTGSQDTEPHQLAVPRVVDSCTSYVIQHGLHTVGLFRVAGSAKRCRMLRAVLESPAPMIPQNSQLTAHDVATVLKEYLRDLPQSLLPKEHYQAYMATARLSGEERLCCCRLLVALLPTPNADTLLVLLRCLHLVVDHCNDTVDEDGMIEPGNRMDARNLATVFAPCILRANHDKLHNCLAESELQIGIVETMIRHVEEIFTIPRELQNKMLTRMRDTEPDRLDRILGAMARANYETDSALPSPFPPMLEEESLKTQKSRKQSVGLRRSDSWPNSMVDEIGVGQQESSSQQPSTSSYTDEKEERPEGRTSGRRHTRRDTHAIIVDSISAVALRANAARRRLRNVFRAFRLTSRSTPNVSTQG